MNNQKKKSSILVNLGISVVVFIVMFGIAELIVRVLYKDTTVMFPRYHTDAIYGEYTLRTIRPNSNFFHTSIDGRWEFTTNDQGFRNYKDFQYEKSEGVVRIVALGDSHTQGYEVEQDFTFSSIIENYLKSKGINAEVINTGVSGFSNAEELLLLESELVKYAPDYVALGFYANDFQDNIKSAFFQLDSNNKLIKTDKTAHIPGVRIQNLIYAIPGIKWLGENSYFYSLLFNNAWSYAKRLLTKKGIEEVMDVAVSTKDKFSDYERTLAARLIERIYETSKNSNAKFVLIDIPSIDKNGVEVPSIDKEFFISIKDKYDYFQSSDNLMQYRGLGIIHQRHGHRHITNFTHTILGVSVGEYIESDTRTSNTRIEKDP